jgi:hypothetical protein
MLPCYRLRQVRSSGHSLRSSAIAWMGHPIEQNRCVSLVYVIWLIAVLAFVALLAWWRGEGRRHHKKHRESFDRRETVLRIKRDQARRATERAFLPTFSLIKYDGHSGDTSSRAKRH